MFLLSTSKTSIVSRIWINFLCIPFRLLILLFSFLPYKLVELPCEHIQGFNFTITSLSSPSVTVLSAMFLAFLSPFSCSLNLFISSSCSFSFPNNAVVLNVVRSLVSNMAVTFDCQDLSRHFQDFDVEILFVKGLSQSNKMIHYMCESFLHICFSSLLSE